MTWYIINNMPLIYYACKCGNTKSKFYRLGKDALSVISCDCGAELKKQLSGPSTASKITVDNGYQSKSVEVDLQIIKSIEENSTKEFREK